MKLYKFFIALLWGIFFWLISFLWGNFVFTIHSLGSLKTIPYVVEYPAISITIVIFFFFFVGPVARAFLKNVEKPLIAGIILGTILSLSNLLLDYLVIFKWLNESNYFNFALIWLSYLILLIRPILIGKKMVITRTKF